MYSLIVAWCWVTVDFYSKYRILWGEIMGDLFMKKTKFKTRIYIIVPTPL